MDKTSAEYQVGKFYLVPTAQLDFGHRTYFVPVIDLPHTDAQLGVNVIHYHIDGRFAIDKAMQNHFRIVNGCTSAVIDSEHTLPYKHIFQKIVHKNKKCVRLHTGLGLPSRANNFSPAIGRFNKFYKSFEGKSCKGRKCPHYGTQMMLQGDKLVCPLHGLEGSPITEKIIHKHIEVIEVNYPFSLDKFVSEVESTIID